MEFLAQGTCTTCGKHTEYVVSHEDAAREMVSHMHSDNHPFVGDVFTKRLNKPVDRKPVVRQRR